MERDELDAKVQRLQDLLGEKLGLGSGDLARRARRAGRRLPVSARAGLIRIAAAQEMARHPKLAARLDRTALDRDYRAAMTALAAIDPASRRQGVWLGMLGGLVFNLLVFGAVALWVLRLRGFL